jgi:hypothetical protein
MATRTAEREEFLADIIVTAVEGGTGYWADVEQYRHDTPAETRATLFEMDEDAPGGYSTNGEAVTLDTIAHGIGLIRERIVPINSNYRLEILRADAQNDAGMIDAEYADAIVQAALFGELRYG